MAIASEWLEKDFYKVLGVTKTASAKEITAAYRKLAKAHHPDTKGGEAGDNGARFKEISLAYDVLGDASKRAEYDKARRLLEGDRSANRAGVRKDQHKPGPNPFQMEDIDFSDLFGGSGFGNSGKYSAARRGADVETAWTLSFRDAILGTTVQLDLTTVAICPVCHGTRAESGSKLGVCGECHGSGTTYTDAGSVSFKLTCTRCGGEGTVALEACKNCYGTGEVSKIRQVKMRIPAGVESGQRIKIKGRGGEGSQGGAAGDLFVVITVKDDPTFARKGRDLTTTLTVPFQVAALGGTAETPTLGKPVTLRIPAGTQPGRIFRVKGKGVALPGGTGDLLVTIEVSVPKTLSDKAKGALEDFAGIVGKEG